MGKTKNLGFQIHSALAEINLQDKKKGPRFLTEKMALILIMSAREHLSKMGQV